MTHCPYRPALVCVALLFTFGAWPCRAYTPAEEMAEAATNFLAALTPAQKARAVIEFKSAERFNWHYIPRQRKGIPFGDLTPPQRQLAHRLLQSALSQQGYSKATNIMVTVELVLRDLENQSPRRNPDHYYITVFGEPAASPWGWRIEGHHLSLNFTVAGGRVLALTPAFLGANPATVPQGPHKGFRALAGEEDLARQLAKSLNDEQRKSVVISDVAPGDIVTAASRKAGRLDPAGIAARQLNATQQALLLSLIREYVFRYRNEIAEADLKRIQDAGFEKIQFAWAGGMESGQKHYYRIQGPTFLMEYDNTQNDANHIHTVWRDFENDFGEDLLRRHYEQAPHPH